MAFNITTKFERTQEFRITEWVFSDAYSQDYSLSWAARVSRRLDVTSSFKLTMTDSIFSQGVDTKEVAPYVEMNLKNPVWDLRLNFKDAISYSNEFNTPRKDVIDYGVEFNVAPNFLPPLRNKYAVNTNFQPGKADLVNRKFESSITYNLGTAVGLDGAWRQETVDDRISLNQDKSKYTWDFTGSYNMTITNALRLAGSIGLTGGRDETLDNAGTVISLTRTHLITTKLRSSLEGYPRLTSYLELTKERDIVLDTLNRKTSFNFQTNQHVLSIGNLKETVQLDYEDKTGGFDANNKKDEDVVLDFSGAPYKYFNYTAKYTLNNKVANYPNPASPIPDVDTQERKSDFSLTATPAEEMVFDLGFSRASNITMGVQTGSVRTWKLKGAIRGELIKMPGMKFLPSFDTSWDTDRITGANSGTKTFKTEFTYALTLPVPYRLNMSSTYTWTRGSGGDKTMTLAVNTTFGLNMKLGAWRVNLETTGALDNTLTDGQTGVFTANKDFRAELTRPLTRNIDTTLKYLYKTPDAGGNSDETSVELEWDLYRTNLKLSYLGNRYFSGSTGSVNKKKYKAEFLADF